MTIDSKKLEELKSSIEKRSAELLEQIGHAQGIGDESTYRYLKNLEVQCSAQLRLIRHIESDFNDTDRYIIC